jgi:hypothetical protein
LCNFLFNYTEGNVKKYKKEINNLVNIEICYNIDLKQPVIVTLSGIHKSHLYPVNTLLTGHLIFVFVYLYFGSYNTNICFDYSIKSTVSIMIVVSNSSDSELYM